MMSLTGYQTAYAAAFAQAFNHWMQTRGLVPEAVAQGLLNRHAPNADDLSRARYYARQQAELCADQYELACEEASEEEEREAMAEAECAREKPCQHPGQPDRTQSCPNCGEFLPTPK